MSFVQRSGTVTVAAAAATDPGLKRAANEDAFLAEAPVFIVADGMGGYEAGDLASAAVVDAFRSRVPGPGAAELTQVRDALLAAEASVAVIAGRTSRGAGSTVSGIVLVDYEGVPHWLVFNVGDSRVYRHTGSELEQLTVDHSLVQQLVDEGALRRDQMSTAEGRNVITRAIGAPDSTADSWLMPVIDGERLLMCTDGLHSEVSDEGIRAALTMSGRPESAAQALVQLAKRAGGRDNITVVVVDVLEGGVDASFGDTTGSLVGDRVLADTGLEGTTVPV